MPGIRARADLEAWLVGAATAAIVLLYALRNGTYDLVARGELGVLIWVAVGVGWLGGVLPRAHPPRSAWVVMAGFVGLAGWTAICLRWTISDERTAIELGRVVHHAGVVALALSVLTRRTYRAALAGLTVALVLVSWLGLCNWLWPDSVATDHARVVLGTSRLTFPLDYWNGMAAWGAMGIVACLAWAAHARAAVWRAAAALPVPGIAVSVYLTYSRGGALEVTFGLLVLLAFAVNRWGTLLAGAVLAGGSAAAILNLREHPGLIDGTGADGAGGVLGLALAAGAVGAAVVIALRLARADDRLRVPRRGAQAGLVAGGVVLLVTAAVAGPGLVDRAVDSFNSAETASAANPTARFTNLGGGRRDQFDAALDLWRDHPVEGTGPGTYEFGFNQSQRYTGFVRDAHSLPLETLAESGVPGLVLTLLALGGLAVGAVLTVAGAGRRRGAAAGAAAVFAAYLFAAGIDWMWELTAVTVAALVAGAAVCVRRSRERAAPPPWPLRAGVAGLALVAVLVILPPVVSTSAVRASQAAVAGGDPAAALRHAEDAIDAAPWAASPVAQKGLLLERAGRLGEAQGYLTLAARREPQNWRYALLGARIAAERGDTGGAIRLYRRAKSLAPRNPALP